MSAASTASADLIDPTKPEKFPVILSDALLGRPPKEVYTGVRYNHRPGDAPPSNARIKNSTPGSGTFDLAFREADGTKYSYNGTRAIDDRQFVLIFDPNRRAFVLHRLDSLFNVNLVATPDNDDAVALREQHPYLSGHGVPPHLERKAGAATAPASVPKGAAAKRAAAKKKADGPTPAQKKKEAAAAKKVAATQKKVTAAAAAAAAAAAEVEAAAAIPLPKAPPKPANPPAASKKKAKDMDSDSDEEESDDDGGLLVEYPEGMAPNQRPRPESSHFSPAFPPQIRRFEDFIQNHGDEDEDADAEADPDDDVPDAYDQIAGGQGYNAAAAAAADSEGEGDDDDLAADLEAELENALGEDMESDVSEED
ncbi:hypothetical protein RB601_000762 [Gaeumannomyces tritici]